MDLSPASPVLSLYFPNPSWQYHPKQHVPTPPAAGSTPPSFMLLLKPLFCVPGLRQGLWKGFIIRNYQSCPGKPLSEPKWAFVSSGRQKMINSWSESCAHDCGIPQGEEEMSPASPKQGETCVDHPCVLSSVRHLWSHNHGHSQVSQWPLSQAQSQESCVCPSLVPYHSAALRKFLIISESH